MKDKIYECIACGYRFKQEKNPVDCHSCHRTGVRALSAKFE